MKTEIILKRSVEVLKDKLKYLKLKRRHAQIKYVFEKVLWEKKMVLIVIRSEVYLYPKKSNKRREVWLQKEIKLPFFGDLLRVYLQVEAIISTIAELPFQDLDH